MTSQPPAERTTEAADPAATAKPVECPVCMNEIPDADGRRDLACPDCGARLVRVDKKWAVIGPAGVPYGIAEDFYRHKTRKCSDCRYRKAFAGYVVVYFFAWLVLVAAIYLGGVDADWLGGWWKIAGLLLFPVVFELAALAVRLISKFLPQDVWRCRSAAAVKCARTRRPARINLNGKCRFFQPRVATRIS